VTRVARVRRREIQCETGDMDQKHFAAWFRIVSIILVLFGITYAFFGLKILPVNADILLDWESALYGAIMMGWGITLLLIGRIAFTRNDLELLKALFYGLAVWLVAEAVFSAYFHVWFNVGVDIGVLLLFGFPLIQTVRMAGRAEFSVHKRPLL
jgi:hypothetical protein